MKTIKELYKEVVANEGLKEEFKKACAENKVEEFLKQNGCDASLEDLKKFAQEERELSLDELDNAAGGMSQCGGDTLISIVSMGVGCAIFAIESAAGADGIYYDDHASAFCGEDD